MKAASLAMREKIIDRLRQIEASELIKKKLTRLEESRKEYINKPAPVAILDDLFRHALAQVWSNR